MNNLQKVNAYVFKYFLEDLYSHYLVSNLVIKIAELNSSIKEELSLLT